MFGNLLLETKRAGISQMEISKRIGISQTAYSEKLNGKRDFKSEEMFAIQRMFFPDKSLEYLFKKEN